MGDGVIEYRAVYIDPTTTQERPDQLLGNSREAIDSWTAAKFRKGPPEAFIEIYQTSERLVDRIQNPKWKDTPVKTS